MSQTATDLDRDRLMALREREQRVFLSRIPRSLALRRRAGSHMPGGVPMMWMQGLYRTPPVYVTHGNGPQFFDVDGNRYLDFNVCDLSMTMGYGPEPIVAAVAEQVRKGANFLLPGEAAIEVSERLAERTGVSFWQFTLSATGANSEVLRIARQLTGRAKVVVFGGHYHGHLEETLVDGERDAVRPAWLGLAREAGRDTRIVPFNAPGALEEALAARDVAVVLTEPALSNCNVVLPDPGFHETLRELTARYGSLLCLDEAHTFQFGYGGLCAAWNLEPDFLVLGKGLGTGIAFGLYGMRPDIATEVERFADRDIGPGGLATGGTLYANAVSVAAAKAALADVLTREAHAAVNALGRELADGLDAAFVRHNVSWKAFRLGPRSGYCLTRELPRNHVEAALSLDYEFIDTRRVYMANRGVWDAVASAGPQASFAHERCHVDEYLTVAEAFLSEVAG